ncbi:VCBS domain-containing protein [Mucilaginibacter sp. BJC16-A38]|uniref:VCBS domain-containing protein n=1 Tax=Mucilaginibacter phenanthrenivorans TaxID=1234842 RepID=UPI0021570703|nr:VCBS domain-containing protein [Mucilaginibacter phenanthrenivorans]MCR8559667.1 VCBS domain-containing protein [Mucilaginibacter phenanthrenivorans]
MKKIILTLSILIGLSAATFAQCDKSVVLSSSKTEHLDEAGAITRTVDENATIELSKTMLDITVNDRKIFSGNVKDNTCNWTTPFKVGKSVVHATVTNDDGAEKQVTITIEGKDGKVTLFFEMEGEPGDKVRVYIDKFTEKA